MRRHKLMQPASWLLSLCILPLAQGCTSAPVQRTVLDYQRAVQDEDYDALFCLSAGASESAELGGDPRERRANFEVWARARLDDYLVGRDDGAVKLDGEAIPLVKLFSLGRGTFFSFGRTRRVGPDAVEVPLSLRFGYSRMDLSRLSPGTTFYLSGAPAGRVHPVRVPGSSRELTFEVLEGLDVVWTLVRAEGRDGCSDGWVVASAGPVAGSETTAEVTWIF
jgi:hypothetical protein